MLNKELIFKTLKDLNLKNTDTIMIHSSLHSIGKIENNAEGLIEALKEYFSNGLIIFPMHTWSFMNSDNQTLDLTIENSCVGMLPNIAFRHGFIRSKHPTHSVVAYGKKAFEYIKYDDTANTPASPSGCFGRLGKMNAKILFLGCPLSKNTFIHSIEEQFNVADRLTDHIYKFYTKDNNGIYEYNVHKHYSKYNAHLSEHYLKLEKPMIEKGIASYFMFGNAKSIIVDAKKCEEYVKELLINNIHEFDNALEVKKC
ncbi:MAG: AAC(3) family N-acetyltransferase [Acholeplasmatales bacterium]|nr:AAC(3) family N-acetyltransferase [Acholeplasmatales bacterium]